jgi:hypothetical protein
MEGSVTLSGVVLEYVVLLSRNHRLRLGISTAAKIARACPRVLPASQACSGNLM